MTTPSQKEFDIIYYLRRFNPETDSQPSWKEYTVHYAPGMTILDGLLQIKQTQDATLAWRYSCRMGVCGSCGMLINGRPALACNTQILDISTTRVALAPLPNFPIIRDLVPDLYIQFDKHKQVAPFIIRKDLEEMNDPTGEYSQTPEELIEYLQFSYCIKCGCCMSACPTLATDSRFLGPQPLAQSYRFSCDTRDDGYKTRKHAITEAHGIFNCHYAGECSRVCPKGVDPARAIQLMKRQLVMDFFKLMKQKGPCRVQGPDPNAQKRPNITPAPPHTIG
jgi:succinate dehydrogenase / fumarate reductase, iron-sulfur subunit